MCLGGSGLGLLVAMGGIVVDGFRTGVGRIGGVVCLVEKSMCVEV